ncbi:hypothetical protein FA95DRAFT_1558051 [Auriscalpium vulgare]|uniref:Uncharacterized protein n=1 Tax=Auriscalpium vulgare TaxID=40419 RepID=A0ACB8RX53_9AGAM|nr:hypothetical protein FA95DRAFT_1558051 [Auriscalpium vulgare]
MTITQEIYNNRSAATRTRTTAQLAASPLQSPADKKGKSKVTEKEPSTPQRDADEGYGGSQATSSAASATGSEVGENGPTMDGAAVTAKPISTSTPRNEKNKKKKKKANQW